MREPLKELGTGRRLVAGPTGAAVAGAEPGRRSPGPSPGLGPQVPLSSSTVTEAAAPVAAPGPQAVSVHAPVRAFDAGGWSDTWFAGHGAVCNLALSPGACARARVLEHRPGPVDVVLRVPDFQDHYAFSPSAPPGRHPLLEAAVRRAAPAGCSLELEVSSPVPAGSSLGTSAAVVVALLGALKALGGQELVPSDLAVAAHEVETVDLGRQSGVQDQAASAFGGASLVVISRYPHFQAKPLAVTPTTWEALQEQTVTMYLGRSHDSSALHQEVIRGLESDRDRLERVMGPVREAAHVAAQGLTSGDLEMYGRALADATQAQSGLHPDLVGPVARRVLDIAKDLGALGWKVNGAGGNGGTVSVLCAPGTRSSLQEVVHELDDVSVLDLRPERYGVRVET